MSDSRERISFTAIRLSLQVGGGFLSAAFILQAYVQRGFLIPAAVVTFILIALIVRSFGGVRLSAFALTTLAWVAGLFLLRLVALPGS